MAYTIDDRTGTVWREDGVIVPLSDYDSPLTLAYAAWLNAGGQHTVITTSAPSRTMTYLTFRRRLTLAERVAINNAPDDPLLPLEVRATLKTMLKDLEVSEHVDLDDQDLITGLAFLVQIGKLDSHHPEELLSDP